MLDYILNECLFSNCRISNLNKLIIEIGNNENGDEIKNNLKQESKDKQNKLTNNNSKSAAFGLVSSLSYDNYSYVNQIFINLIEYHK